MLEAVKTPPQQPLVDFIRKGLAGLAVDSWCAVKVYGRRAGEEFPDWVQEFKVRREGDVKAIATLINQKLQASRIVAKVSTKNDCLQVMLEAAEVPNQEQMVALLQSEFQELGVQGIKSLRLYGQQSGEDFPDWQEEIKLFADKIESQEIKPTSPDLSLSSGVSEQVQTLPVVREVDSVGLSNQLYTAIQTTCYQHLHYKVSSEDDKTIHEIVENFVYELEAALKRDLDQFAKQVVNITKSFGVQLEQTKVQAIVSDVTDSNFAELRLAIRDLEQVTQKVLQTDFPQESNALEAFFTGGAQEFTANLYGETSIPPEAVIGATIGSFIAPGIGSVIGGAIGGWLAGNKQQKALEQLRDKYQKARDRVWQKWESIMQVVYGKLRDLLYDTTSIRLLTYQSLAQAINFYNQGNEYLAKDFQKAIKIL
ncbi:MAG: hypothetical protein NZ660_11005 [Oscillatoriaceae bacterium SKYG93]|nr:hypothetical protein [Oscillatoriaceae bacterium SKYG93]MDW8453973.1 hypothetical protein [Oscillatoriaceae cyanobacterium SKYGB_i_bin93]